VGFYSKFSLAALLHSHDRPCGELVDHGGYSIQLPPRPLPMMTNQRMGALDNTPRGVSLEQRGGTLYQAGGYVNNQLSGYSSSLPSLGNLSVLQPAPSQPVTLSIKLDGQATSDIMEGKAVEVIASNPRAVHASASAAMRSSFGRRDTARTTLDPFLVTG
jgi:hypothetical protein